MCIQPLCCRNRFSYQYCRMGRSHSIGQVAARGSIHNTGGTVTAATIENYTLFLPLFFFFLCALVVSLYCCLCSVHSVRSRPETSLHQERTPAECFFVSFDTHEVERKGWNEGRLTKTKPANFYIWCAQFDWLGRRFRCAAVVSV